ncbi:MAG: isoleucine--tRNA ligase [Gammaproteobacteria bacterium]|nr:isoleucine--tRNA ligase [Gammaproteobacteria bacterium]
MTDYKNTLNLPKTAFKMKANLAEREPNMLKRWKEQDIYNHLRKLRKGKQKFILHLGPPYANGDIHMGHAITTVLKDIVVKSQSMNGYDAPLVPGWDCHGLPIAIKVEEKIGKEGEKVSPAEFRKACREYATKQIHIQRESFKRLGIFADWDHPYLTMDPKYEADIIRALAKVIENGHLQRGVKPVYWCSDCASALAEAEIEYRDKKSPTIDVRFYVVHEKDFLNRCKIKKASKGKLSVPIWTTTPWTLPANRAVALNPKFDYVIVAGQTEKGDERFLIARDLLEPVMQRYGIAHYEIVAECQGKDLEHLELHHPFYDRKVPIILADHVTLDAGTGAVHTAPGHGQEDYVVGVQYGLEIDSPLDDDGCFVKGTPIFEGKYVFDANDDVIALLKDKEVLIHHEVIEHSYPHCWRHKTPVIFRATSQWFISMDHMHLREDALAQIAKTEWIPAWGESRITSMVANRPDWCISRQRTWGVPIAIFVHQETGELHPRNLELMEEAAKRVEKAGIEAWYQLDPVELLGDEAKDYQKVTDIVDVWFESGASFACVLMARPELQFPANIYLEGSDQHRGWFQTSLLIGCAMNVGAPFRQVLTHGFTVDEHGHKMSKSLGNVIPPSDITNTLGADVLRLWVASVDYTTDIAVSETIFAHLSDVYRRIRNTARFLLGNLEGFEPDRHEVSFKNMLALDCWLVDRARYLQEQIMKAYDTYQFHQVFQMIHHFCTIELGSFYLDVIKDRQYTMQTDSLGRRSAQTAMFYVLEALVRWIAPVLSFTADEIWEYMPGKRGQSVFLETWYAPVEAMKEQGNMNQEFWAKVIQVRDEVNREIEKLRAQGALGSSLEAEVTLYAAPSLKALLDQLGDELRFVLITSAAQVKSLASAQKDAVQTTLEDLKIAVVVSKEPKCIRCWHRREDVGKNADHPEICARCVQNVEEGGEKRQFA